MRVRRSELTTPGSSLDMLEKAAGSPADEVMLDLEDAVAPNEKDVARERVVTALTDFDWSNKVVAVRINDLGHPNAYRDLIDVVEGAGELIDTIIIPKATCAEDIYVVATLLNQIEAQIGLEHEIGIEVLIEETEAVQNVDAIAAASDRLEALIFGPGDYSAAQGVDTESPGSQAPEGHYPGDIWHYVRNKIVIAARSNGLDAIDGPFSNFDDPEGYRRECRWSKSLGFVGKWAIHPSQIEIANDVYRPSDEQIEKAQRIVEAMEAGHDSGLGAVQLDGEMLDEAVVRQARLTLERARTVGVID